jgi:alpha-L-rhamnosidase
MKAWVDYIRRHDEKTGNKRLWIGDFHYADWLALDSEDPIGYRFGGTEHAYLASCYYRYSALLVSKAAAVLGNREDSEFYGKLSEEVRAAILAEYMTSSGRLAVTTQTAYVLALHFDILPAEHREKAVRALKAKLCDSNFHLRTGFIGTPYLCRVLSGCGLNDISYRLLLQEDFPSWLYQINMGATTIWERWNSILPDGRISDTGMNSLNHYSYGSIVEWMYRDMAGINPLEEYPGFRRFTLAPKPHRLIQSAEAEYLSPAGRIASAWEITAEGGLKLRFSVPFGSVAELTLPGRCDEYPRELTAGEHEFSYMPEKPLLAIPDMDTPVSELCQNEKAYEAVRDELPELTQVMMFQMLAGDKSLDDFIKDGYVNLNPEKRQRLEARLMAAAEEAVKERERV